MLKKHSRKNQTTLNFKENTKNKVIPLLQIRSWVSNFINYSHSFCSISVLGLHLFYTPFTKHMYQNVCVLPKQIDASEPPKKYTISRLSLLSF